VKRREEKVVVLRRADIDRFTQVEVTLDCEAMQLMLAVYRKPLLRYSWVREEYGRFGTVGELVEHLHRLFGEATARRVAHPSREKYTVASGTQ